MFSKFQRVDNRMVLVLYVQVYVVLDDELSPRVSLTVTRKTITGVHFKTQCLLRCRCCLHVLLPILRETSVAFSTLKKACAPAYYRMA